MAEATTAAAPAAETRVNIFLAQVYLLMFVGLAITGVVSYWVSENTAFAAGLATSTALVWRIWIVQVILVHVINVRVMKISAGGAAIGGLIGLSRHGEEIGKRSRDSSKTSWDLKTPLWPF